MDELSFLKKLLPNLQNQAGVTVPPGDDCAAVPWSGDQLMLLAVDQVVANRHFLYPGTDPAIAGRKLLARNLSDIAAMGGVPKFMLVSSAASTDFDQSFHEAFSRGIIDLGQKTGTALIGGDVAGMDHGFQAALTIVGEVHKDKILLRKGVKTGDFLVSTGLLGDSFETEHHLHFEPRLAEGAWLADQQLANAMMDISDGLLLDGARLAETNQLKLVINTAVLPKRNEKCTIKKCLTDGEDYELLFAVSPEKMADLEQKWPFSTKLTKIGQFEEGEGVFDESGQNLFTTYAHYDHFREAGGE